MLLLRSQRGSLTLALIIAGVLLAAGLAGMDMMLNLQRKVQYAELRSTLTGIEADLKQHFSQPASCICHFTAQNIADEATTKINTATTPAPDLKLTSLRSNCDFLSSENILASLGQPVSGFNVTSIAVTDLQPGDTMNVFKGTLSIAVSSPATTMALRPISIPLKFAVDLSQGTADARPISACLPESGGVVTGCPPGFQIMSPPGTARAICMETNLRPALGNSAASAACATVQDETLGRARLCNLARLYEGCAISTAFSDFGAGEWTADFFFPGGTSLSTESHGIVMGTGACANVIASPTSTPHPFRCCLPM